MTGGRWWGAQSVHGHNWPAVPRWWPALVEPAAVTLARDLVDELAGRAHVVHAPSWSDPSTPVDNPVGDAHPVHAPSWTVRAVHERLGAHRGMVSTPTDRRPGPLDHWTPTELLDGPTGIRARLAEMLADRQHTPPPPLTAPIPTAPLVYRLSARQALAWRRELVPTDPDRPRLLAPPAWVAPADTDRPDGIPPGDPWEPIEDAHGWLVALHRRTQGRGFVDLVTSASPREVAGARAAGEPILPRVPVRAHPVDGMTWDRNPIAVRITDPEAPTGPPVAPYAFTQAARWDALAAQATQERDRSPWPADATEHHPTGHTRGAPADLIRDGLAAAYRDAVDRAVIGDPHGRALVGILPDPVHGPREAPRGTPPCTCPAAWTSTGSRAAGCPVHDPRSTPMWDPATRAHLFDRPPVTHVAGIPVHADPAIPEDVAVLIAHPQDEDRPAPTPDGPAHEFARWVRRYHPTPAVDLDDLPALADAWTRRQATQEDPPVPDPTQDPDDADALRAHLDAHPPTDRPRPHYQRPDDPHDRATVADRAQAIRAELDALPTVDPWTGTRAHLDAHRGKLRRELDAIERPVRTAPAGWQEKARARAQEARQDAPQADPLAEPAARRWMTDDARLWTAPAGTPWPDTVTAEPPPPWTRDRRPGSYGGRPGPIDHWDDEDPPAVVERARDYLAGRSDDLAVRLAAVGPELGTPGPDPVEDTEPAPDTGTHDVPCARTPWLAAWWPTDADHGPLALRGPACTCAGWTAEQRAAWAAQAAADGALLLPGLQLVPSLAEPDAPPAPEGSVAEEIQHAAGRQRERADTGPGLPPPGAVPHDPRLVPLHRPQATTPPTSCPLRPWADCTPHPLHADDPAACRTECTRLAGLLDLAGQADLEDVLAAAEAPRTGTWTTAPEVVTPGWDDDPRDDDERRTRDDLAAPEELQGEPLRGTVRIPGVTLTAGRLYVAPIGTPPPGADDDLPAPDEEPPPADGASGQDGAPDPDATPGWVEVGGLAGMKLDPLPDDDDACAQAPYAVDVVPAWTTAATSFVVEMQQVATGWLDLLVPGWRQARDAERRRRVGRHNRGMRAKAMHARKWSGRE